MEVTERYAIVWTSQYGVEDIDHADTRDEAEYLRREYALVYRGNGVVSVEHRASGEE